MLVNRPRQAVGDTRNKSAVRRTFVEQIFSVCINFALGGDRRVYRRAYAAHKHHFTLQMMQEGRYVVFRQNALPYIYTYFNHIVDYVGAVAVGVVNYDNALGFHI